MVWCVMFADTVDIVTVWYSTELKTQFITISHGLQ